MGKTVIETERLLLRELEPSDLNALCRIMCDAEAMRAAYETPFRPEEVQAWIGRHLQRYETLGYGLWAVILKQTGELIGQCGLTLQRWDEEELLEIGYLFAKAHWHRGYAAEAAVACKDYAFSVLGAERVCSMIRDTHIASQNVALRCGMRPVDQAVKRFRNVDMTFWLYVAERSENKT